MRAQQAEPYAGCVDDVDRFVAAAERPGCVVLEGFHALKHAIRFRADIEMVVASKPTDRLVAEMAPDLAERLNASGPDAIAVHEVSAGQLRSLPGRPHPTGIAAVARRPNAVLWSELRADRPVVVLDDPQHHGNIGASVRVSAAAGAAGLLTIGDVNPWTPEALRGSAGLHFAIPVLGESDLPETDRPIYAFDAEGDPIGSLPNEAVLVFGSERYGLSRPLQKRADHIVSFPMEPGVSSINLATSVAVGLYAWRLNTAHR